MGALLVFWATPLGPGTSPDSALYVCAAQSLIARGALCSCGTTSPMTHQRAPLYPVLLATVSVFGATPLRAARWIDALSCAASVILTGALLYAATSSMFISLLGELLFLCLGDVAAVHLAALSEAPFIVFLLLFVLGLWRAVDDSGSGWIVVAGSAAAAACLTRYMGVSLLVTGASGLICLGAGPMAARMRRSALFLAIGGTPPAAWLIHNYLESRDITGRSLHWHPISSAQLMLACTTVAHWLFPWMSNQTAQSIGLPLLVGMAVILATVVWSNPGTLGWLLANLVLCNSALILVSRYVSDPNLVFGPRILAPILVSSLVLTLWGAHSIANRLGASVRWRVIGFGLGLSFAIVSGRATARIVYQSRVDGLGYTAHYYADSALIGWIRHLPAETVIYADEPEPIGLFADRFAEALPLLRDPLTGQAAKGFKQELAAMQSKMTERPIAIAYFYKILSDRQDSLPALADMPSVYHLSMTPVLEAPQGIIYEARPTETATPARITNTAPRGAVE